MQHEAYIIRTDLGVRWICTCGYVGIMPNNTSEAYALGAALAGIREHSKATHGTESMPAYTAHRGCTGHVLIET